MAPTTQLDDNISRIGHEIYETQLRPKVETDENIGKLISIDITVMAMGSRPLVGTELLQGFNLSADFEEDGELTLTAL